MMPASYNQVGVPSSSGYPVYSGLINPIFARAFTTRMYAETVHGRITSTSVVPQELRSSGDLAIFKRPPRGQIFKYNKNQDLDVSHFNSSEFSFRVDKAWYLNIKLDKMDVKQIPDIKMWIKMFMDDSLEQLGAQIDHDIIQTMVADAHHCNKGNRAGVRSHMYRLGQVGAPLALESGGQINPLTLTAVMRAVLGEQNVRANRDTFVVWPQAVEMLFLNNPVMANAYASGLNQSALITGTVTQVQGVNHLFSPNTPVYKDPVTGEMTYPVVMGLRSATGYVQQMRDNEVITQDARAFAQYFRALLVSGWGVLEPCQLAVAYVTVKGLF